MTDETENRNYNVPEPGEENWDEPVNENWHLIDEDVQNALEKAQKALDAATSDDDDDEEVETSGSGYSWDQTHVDTQWLFDADSNDNITVEKVTNLNADGSGSLDAALSAAENNANTLIVFEVGGVIDYGGETYIRSYADNVYIAGQTAPYPGITFTRGGIRVHGDNTIVEHMAFLPGDEVDEPHKARAITYNQGASNILFDHCMAGWAPDTNVNFRDDLNRCAFINGINSEPLNDSSHPEAPHGYGLLIRAGSQDITYMGNLMTHNWKRNLKPNENCHIAYINNYVYNWGDTVQHGGESTSEVDWVDVVVESGPDTSTYKYGVFADHPATVYFAENAESDVQLSPSDTPLNDSEITYANDPMHLPTDFSESDAVPVDDLGAFLSSNVGPRPADRPSVEERIVTDFQNRDGQIIDHHDDVGGYPDYASQTRSLEPPSTDVLDWLQQYTAEVESTG